MDRLHKIRGKQHGDLTRAIIGCAFEVINELGAGFLESVYEQAMCVALRHKGIPVRCQHPIEVTFRGESCGHFYADLFADERVVVELKAVKAIAPEHQAQITNYLKATGIDVGLLINFGNPKLEYRRFTRKKNMDVQDSQDRIVPSPTRATEAT